MAAGGTIGQVEALLGERRFAEAAPLLIRRRGGGRAGALRPQLAHWRIAGNIVRRDLAEARRLLGLAGAEGRLPTPALLHAYFLAGGTGGRR